MDISARLVHVCHQSAVGGHVGVAFEENVVLAHLGSQLLRGGAVLPVVEIVGALVHGLFLRVVEPLETVGHREGLAVAGEILDKSGRGLDDVGVQPEHPRRVRSESGEEKRVAGLGHSSPSRLLVRHLMALALVLRGDGRVEVLPEDDDALKPFLLQSMLLDLCDLLLELDGGGIALLGLGQNKAQCDELMGVREFQQVVPILLVEASHGRKDKHILAVGNGVVRNGDIVEVVACNWWRARLAANSA